MSTPLSSKRLRKRGTPRRRLERIFLAVRRLVSRKFSRLGRIALYVDCEEILAFRARHAGTLKGRRAFAHEGHIRSAICTIRELGLERKGVIAGVFLHEFGHAAGNRGEVAADLWVQRNFGIAINYVGELLLECVDPGEVPGL